MTRAPLRAIPHFGAINHIVLTRFNASPKKASHPIGLSEEWLAHRFDLFEKICLPSLHSQSCQDFLWLVLFNRRTPEKYLEKIESYARWSRLIPCFIVDANDYDLDALVRPHLSSVADYLVTSRIDNDDAYSRDYIETIQTHLSHPAPFVLNFPHGFKFDIPHEKLYQVYHLANPFASYVEKIGKTRLRTVQDTGHLYLQKLGPVHQIADTPKWLVGVHQHNINNRIGNQRRVSLHHLADHFQTEFEFDIRENAVEIPLTNLLAMLNRSPRKLADLLAAVRNRGSRFHT